MNAKKGGHEVIIDEGLLIIVAETRARALGLRSLCRLVMLSALVKAEKSVFFLENLVRQKCTGHLFIITQHRPATH